MREVVTLLLLMFGGLLIFGWFIGVFLLWTSDRWNLREKLIGILVWPFGFIGAISLLRIPVSLPVAPEIIVGSLVFFAPLLVLGYLLKKAQPGRARLNYCRPRSVRRAVRSLLRASPALGSSRTPLSTWLR